MGMCWHAHPTQRSDHLPRRSEDFKVPDGAASHTNPDIDNTEEDWWWQTRSTQEAGPCTCRAESPGDGQNDKGAGINGPRTSVPPIGGGARLSRGESRKALLTVAARLGAVWSAVPEWHSAAVGHRRWGWSKLMALASAKG
mmetsp:Transcript_35400/g.72864  ORF Transcript_35400/g.72864 Transcript_35400/m.72864 type:complete len:141 (-) Transcript_35400:262-684(-)